MKLVAVFLLCAWLTLGGCASQPGLEGNLLQPGFPSLPPARLAPVPAAAGVFYPPQFAERVLGDRSAPGFRHRPGPASMALFDHVLASVFERATRLSAWPPPAGAAQPDVSLVFVPAIAGIATVRTWPGETTSGFTGRLIEYRIDVYTPAGDRIDSWTLYARSRMDGAWTPGDDRLYAAALRDAAAQLLASIPRRPALQSWLPAAPRGEIPARGPDAGQRGPIRLAITSLLEPVESRDRGTASEAACLANTLTQAIPRASVVPIEQIRDAVFPWLEHSVVMDTARQMPDLVRQSAVRDGLRDAGIDYLALIQSERSSERNPDAVRCDTTYRAPGCSGVRGDALKTRLQVTLWNLRRFTMSARFEVESAGAATIAGLAVPIPGAGQTSASACERAAAAIGALIDSR